MEMKQRLNTDDDNSVKEQYFYRPYTLIPLSLSPIAPAAFDLTLATTPSSGSLRDLFSIQFAYDLHM